MQDAEQFSALVADIYDTTLDPSLWPHVLAKMCGFVGGCAANLFSQDTLCDIAQVHYSWGDDPVYRQSYLEKYIKMNPFFPAITFGEIGRVSVQSDLVPFDEFHRTRFFREWAHPQGYVDCLFSILEKEPTGCAMITVRRGVPDGLADEESCRRMQLIVPHVRRAVLLSRALEHSQASCATLTNMLDRMSAAIFLIGMNGHIVHVNDAGTALLDRDDIVTERGGKLAARREPNLEALSLLLSSTGSVEVKAGITPFILSTGEHYLAQVLPLTSGLRQVVGAAHAAVAAIFIRKAKVGWISPVEALAKLYKLTPSEIRVLLAIAEAESVSEAADTLGISQDTIKTHLKHLFEKTGKRRQTELVKLLADFAPAV